MARLGFKRKQLLGAVLTACALCTWQFFCVRPPLPDLAWPEVWFVDQAAPGVNPAVARRLTRDMLEARTLAPGEVRGVINAHKVVAPIDPDAVCPEGPGAWPRMAGLALWGKSRAVQRPSPTYTMACFIPQPVPGVRPLLSAPAGSLSARFESGADGPASVGHTPSAGTSYGTFQIASGTPTYGNFLRYLHERAPDIHHKLVSGGQANTGSTEGSVPDQWRRVAAEDSRRFERLQYEFIVATHYRPALSYIYARSGLDVSTLSPAMKEVLMSSAVQHGPGGATEIFVASVAAIKDQVVEEKQMAHFERALIEEIYSRRLRAFGGVPMIWREAMANRFFREKSQALSLLERHYSGT